MITKKNPKSYFYIYRIFMKHKIFKNSLDGRFNPKTVILSKIRVKTMEKTLTQLKVNINMTGLTLIVRGF